MLMPGEWALLDLTDALVSLKKASLSSLELINKSQKAAIQKLMRWLYRCCKLYRVFSHDVTSAILVSHNNKTAAMLVSQTSPLGVEFLSYANAFFCSNKFA